MAQTTMIGELGRRRSGFASRLWRQVRSRPLLYLLAAVMVLVFAFPVYYMLIMSLMTQAETEIWPPLFFPGSWRWDNYSTMASMVPLWQWLWNTVQITFFYVIGTTLSSAIVGYGFARFRFPFRTGLFLITLATMRLPGQITLIPQFVVFHRLNWINTYLPLIVPAYFGGGAFYIFLMRQFVMQLPRDLDEAAIMDGASYPRILFSVLLPLMMPAVATVAIIAFMASWNDFMGPLIYLQSSKLYTLSVGLRYWDTSGFTEQRAMPQYMATMSTIMALPCIALFFSAQRVFVRGIATSGIKG